jgi:hypothetical protein
MSLFRSPEDHAANPPETWKVVKVTKRLWRLTTKDGIGIASYPRQSDAESATTSGFYVDLYAKETRWYAGEQVDGWKPYTEVHG